MNRAELLIVVDLYLAALHLQFLYTKKINSDLLRDIFYQVPYHWQVTLWITIYIDGIYQWIPEHLSAD